jgi:hypothetical protein
MKRLKIIEKIRPSKTARLYPVPLQRLVGHRPVYLAKYFFVNTRGVTNRTSIIVLKTMLNMTPYMAEIAVSAQYQIPVPNAKPFQAHISRVLNG